MVDLVRTWGVVHGTDIRKLHEAVLDAEDAKFSPRSMDRVAKMDIWTSLPASESIVARAVHLANSKLVPIDIPDEFKPMVNAFITHMNISTALTESMTREYYNEAQECVRDLFAKKTKTQPSIVTAIDDPDDEDELAQFVEDNDAGTQRLTLLTSIRI